MPDNFNRFFGFGTAMLLALSLNTAPVDRAPANLATLPPIVGQETRPVQAEGYVFRVVDQDGEPVEGVYVQFCNDEQCMIAPTDAAGTVVFEADAGSYTAHLLTTPEGYKANDEEYELTETGVETVFTLERE